MFASYARALLLPRRGSGPLPERRLERRGAAPDPGRLARYAQVCGFEGTDPLPVTYPQVLAFPLAMSLMSRRDFPFRLPGLVHIANRVEQLRPLAPREPLTYRVAAGRPEPHPRGTAFDVLTEAVDTADAPVWRSAATYLRRHPVDGAGPVDGTGPGRAAPEHAARGAEPRTERWTVPADTGRRYAAVSGDRNPIHLHPLTARPFGYRRAIAHGMWTAARCLAAARRARPDAFPGAYTAETAFHKPLALPAEVTFLLWESGQGLGFALRPAAGGPAERPYVQGRVEAS